MGQGAPSKAVIVIEGPSQAVVLGSMVIGAAGVLAFLTAQKKQDRVASTAASEKMQDSSQRFRMDEVKIETLPPAGLPREESMQKAIEFYIGDPPEEVCPDSYTASHYPECTQGYQGYQGNWARCTVNSWEQVQAVDVADVAVTSAVAQAVVQAAVQAAMQAAKHSTESSKQQVAQPRIPKLHLAESHSRHSGHLYLSGSSDASGAENSARSTHDTDPSTTASTPLELSPRNECSCDVQEKTMQNFDCTACPIDAIVMERQTSTPVVNLWGGYKMYALPA
jgi:hypothetical protein